MKVVAMVLATGLTVLLLAYIASSMVSIVKTIAAKKRAKAARNFEGKENNS